MYSFNNPNGITYNPNTSKYSVTFAGKTIETTVTDKGAVADEWVRNILSIHGNTPMVVVGLDIEWRPHEISWMSNKSATLQLCIDEKCLILQLFYVDEIPESLKDFLNSTNFTFVGIEVGDDVKKLKNEYGLNCCKSADICAIAKQRWPGRFRRPGLKDLALEIAGLNMKKPKHVCRSNWEARELSMRALMLMLLIRLATSFCLSEGLFGNHGIGMHNIIVLATTYFGSYHLVILQ